MRLYRALVKRATLMKITLSLFLLISACSQATPHSTPTGEDEKAVITFVAAEYSSVTRPLLENLVKEFENKYPYIHVELQVVNWDILDSVYTTMISKNQPPDLLITNVYSHFAKDGLLNNFNDILSDDLKSKFY